MKQNNYILAILIGLFVVPSSWSAEAEKKPAITNQTIAVSHISYSKKFPIPMNEARRLQYFRQLPIALKATAEVLTWIAPVEKDLAEEAWY